jgi:lipopolysaccharide transport system permease protein
MLGYFWVIGPPIASTLLFVFLHSQRILNIGATDVPYAVYVLTGLVLWQTFSASLTTPMARVGAAKKMLGKLNFPREALLLSGVYHVVFNLSIKLVLLAGVYAFFGVMPAWTVVFAPLGIFALIVLGLTIGLLLVPFAMLYQDVNRALGMAMNAWMLLTPVVYPPPTGWPASAVNWLNPVSPLLATTRQLATTGSVSQGWAFAAVLAASMLLLLAGWALYRLAMPHLVARMSA